MRRGVIALKVGQELRVPRCARGLRGLPKGPRRKVRSKGERNVVRNESKMDMFNLKGKHNKRRVLIPMAENAVDEWDDLADPDFMKRMELRSAVAGKIVFSDVDFSRIDEPGAAHPLPGDTTAEEIARFEKQAHEITGMKHGQLRRVQVESEDVSPVSLDMNVSTSKSVLVLGDVAKASVQESLPERLRESALHRVRMASRNSDWKGALEAYQDLREEQNSQIEGNVAVQRAEGWIVRSYMKLGKVKDATDFFASWVIDEGREPSSWQVATILDGLLDNNQVARAQRVWDSLSMRFGFETDVYVLRSLLRIENRKKNGYKALELFKRWEDEVFSLADLRLADMGYFMDRREVMRVRTMFHLTMGACAGDRNNINNTFEIYSRMRGFELPPNNVSLTILMQACALLRDEEKANALWDQVTEEMAMEPSIESYSAMMNVYAELVKKAKSPARKLDYWEKSKPADYISPEPFDEAREVARAIKFMPNDAYFNPKYRKWVQLSLNQHANADREAKLDGTWRQEFLDLHIWERSSFFDKARVMEEIEKFKTEGEVPLTIHALEEGDQAPLALNATSFSVPEEEFVHVGSDSKIGNERLQSPEAIQFLDQTSAMGLSRDDARKVILGMDDDEYLSFQGLPNRADDDGTEKRMKEIDETGDPKQGFEDWSNKDEEIEEDEFDDDEEQDEEAEEIDLNNEAQAATFFDELAAMDERKAWKGHRLEHPAAKLLMHRADKMNLSFGAVRNIILEMSEAEYQDMAASIVSSLDLDTSFLDKDAIAASERLLSTLNKIQDDPFDYGDSVAIPEPERIERHEFLVKRDPNRERDHMTLYENPEALFEYVVEEMGLQPTSRFLNEYFSVYANGLRMYKADEVFGMIESRFGLKPDRFTYDMMIKMYAKMRRMEKAQHYFDEAKRSLGGMKKMHPDSIGWLMRGYAKVYRMDEALHYLSLMRELKIFPHEKFVRLVRVRVAETGIDFPNDLVPEDPHKWRSSLAFAEAARNNSGSKKRRKTTIDVRNAALNVIAKHKPMN